MGNRINTYTCKTCGRYIVTEDVNQGTTPMMLSCRATPGCNGSMISGMYQVSQNLTPTHEWYKPAKLPKGAMRQHIEMGGLMLREKRMPKPITVQDIVRNPDITRRWGKDRPILCPDCCKAYTWDDRCRKCRRKAERAKTKR